MTPTLYIYIYICIYIYIYTVPANRVGGAVYLTLMSYHHLLTKPGDAKI